ncbi:MAG TPA: hypothetical protein VF756_18000 [Thermoanaerobaculia bacterium]
MSQTSCGPAQSLDVQVAATLAAIAYLGKDDDRDPVEQYKLMSAALQASALPTAGQWTIVWGPANLKGDLLYIAQGPASGSQEQFAVVIRGTVFTSVYDLTQDREVGDQDALPFTAPSGFDGALISRGAEASWTNLSSAQPVQGVPGSGTALSFLQSQGSGFKLLVAGHSLGAQLATVAGVWLAQALSSQSPSLAVIAFAPPTAGNPQFADGFAKLFQGTETALFANQLDIVPRLWDEAGIESIKQLYPNPGPHCDLGCDGFVGTAKHLVRKVAYQQPSGIQSLPGQVYDLTGIGRFEDEANDQHRELYYMCLVGISVDAIQNIATWSPPGSSS